jgi:hypothetical protein
MTFGERKEAIRYFEEARGAIFRNLSYAGIAAAWTLKHDQGQLSAWLVWAIALFSLYLGLDAIYVYRMANEEREEYLELEAEFKRKNSNEVPGNDVKANYDKTKIRSNVICAKVYPLALVPAYVCLIVGAVDSLARLSKYASGECL